MGKIKKTDAAGKTVEAWWALLFADGSLGQFIVRWGWLVIGGGAGAWVASVTDWISSYGVAGWAATITIGALSAIWGVAGLEHVRSKRWSREHPLAEHTELSDGDLKELIDARLNEFHATKLRAEFATHAQTHAFDEKLADLSEKAKIAQGSAKLAFGHADSEIARVEARISEMADKVDRLGSFAEQHVRNTRERFQNVDGGFKAMRHREQLAYHAEMIEELAGMLLCIREGKPVENWGEWSSLSSRWLTGVSMWIAIAEIYRDGCKQRIMVVAPEELHGNWPEDDSLFPNIDAIMAYRKIAVTLGHFRLEQKPVDEAIVLAAFHAPSMKGRDYPKGEGQ